MHICETIYRKIVGSRMKIRNLSLLLEETKNVNTQKDLEEIKLKFKSFKETDLQRFSKNIDEINVLKMNFEEEFSKIGRVKSFKHDEEGFIKELEFLGFLNGNVDLKGFEKLEKIVINTLQKILKLSLPKKLLHLEFNKAEFLDGKIDLSECESIDRILIQDCNFSQLKSPQKAKSIVVSRCFNNISQLDFSSVEGLEELNISFLNGLKGLIPPTTIKKLTIFSCPNLEETLDLRHLTELEQLDLSITNIVDLFLPPNIKKLDLTDCKKLKNLTNLEELTSLDEIITDSNLFQKIIPKAFKEITPGVYKRKKAKISSFKNLNFVNLF